MKFNIGMKSLLKLLIFIGLFFCYLGVQAATIQSTLTGGVWSNTGTWIGGIIPTSNDTVILNSDVTLLSDLEYQGVVNLNSFSLNVDNTKEIFFKDIKGGELLGFINNGDDSTIFVNTISGVTTNIGLIDVTRSINNVVGKNLTVSGFVSGDLDFMNINLRNFVQTRFLGQTNIIGNVYIPSNGQLRNFSNTDNFSLVINGNVENNGFIGFNSSSRSSGFKIIINGALLNNKTISYIDIAVNGDIQNSESSSWSRSNLILGNSESTTEQKIIGSQNFSPNTTLKGDVNILGDILFNGSIALNDNSLFVDTSNNIYFKNISNGKIINNNLSGGETVYFKNVSQLDTNIETIDVDGNISNVTGKELIVSGNISGDLNFSSIYSRIGFETRVTGQTYTSGNIYIPENSALRNFSNNDVYSFVINGDTFNNGTLGGRPSSKSENFFIDSRGYLKNNGTIDDINIKLYSDFINSGDVQNSSKVFLSWDPIEDYDDYSLSITGQDDIDITNTTRYQIDNNILNNSSDIFWKVKGEGFFTDSEYTDEKCINVQSCGQVVLPVPTLLTQSFIAPLTDVPQEIDIGESIGKFQSGSGVLFGATLDGDILTGAFLEVNVLDMSFNNIASGTGSFNGVGEADVTLLLSRGEYIWNAKTVDIEGNESEIALFSSDTPGQARFKIYEGFEPYPFGYKFINSYASPTYLDGGITFPILGEQFTRERNLGTKWDIFEGAFNTQGISERQRIGAFEALGLSNVNNLLSSGGSCYGMVISAAMEKEQNDYLQNHYVDLHNKIGNGNIWDSVEKPKLASDNRWTDDPNTVEDDGILDDILSVHLSQKGDFSKYEGISIYEPTSIIQEINNNPDKTHLLFFSGIQDGKEVSHIVTPYRTEDNKIYFWDSNFPYLGRVNIPDLINPYNQFITVIDNNNWNSEIYTNNGWTQFSSMFLIDANAFYNDGEKPPIPGVNGIDILYSYSGESNFLVKDQNGNRSGYLNGSTINEIAGVSILESYNALLGDNNVDDFKQIYLSEKIDGLTIEIIGTENEEYDLMIAGGDYYTKLEGVSTNSGQIDTFTTTAINLEIDFDDTKTGNYNILVDNFQNSGTGTVYVDSVGVVPEQQNFTIDWDKVVTDQDDAVTYETGDTVIGVPAIATGEELIEEEIVEPQESTYVYPSKTISWNSGQQRAISSWYSIVPNFDEYNWGEDIAFTTSGEGNPTVNTTSSGRQSSGVLRSGANIQMDVPPVGESYTSYLHIGEYTLELTTSRDAAPEANVGTLDFGTKTVNYSGTATSNWVSFPFLSEPTQFTVTGGGNPTAQNLEGQRSSTGSIRWGTNIKAEIPEPGEMRIIEFEILGKTGTFTIIRQ